MSDRLKLETVGSASSSTMVNVPVASLIEALLAFDKVSVAVSLLSSKVSTKIGTLIVAVVLPAAIVTVPEVAV